MQARALLAVLSKTGELLHYQEFDVMDDRFAALVGNGQAKVSSTYQRAMKFGEEKVVMSISLTCNQDENTINTASGLAFYKALELTDWAYGVLMAQAQATPKQG